MEDIRKVGVFEATEEIINLGKHCGEGAGGNPSVG